MKKIRLSKIYIFLLLALQSLVLVKALIEETRIIYSSNEIINQYFKIFSLSFFYLLAYLFYKIFQIIQKKKDIIPILFIFCAIITVYVQYNSILSAISSILAILKYVLCENGSYHFPTFLFSLSLNIVSILFCIYRAFLFLLRKTRIDTFFIKDKEILPYALVYASFIGFVYAYMKEYMIVMEYYYYHNRDLCMQLEFIILSGTLIVFFFLPLFFISRLYQVIRKKINLKRFFAEIFLSYLIMYGMSEIFVVFMDCIRISLNFFIN